MQIVYLGQSIQAATTLSTSWWATLTQSLSLSPYVSIDLALSRTKTIYHHVEPNSTYSHCILSHAHCLSRSIHPSRHHSFHLMVGHAHSISLSLSLRMSRLTSLFLGQKRYITMLSPIRPIHIVYSLTHIVYLGHSLQPVSLFRSHGDPM